MPLSRVAIAAVFLILGALVIIPVFDADSSRPSRAADSRSSSPASPSAGAGASASPTRTPGHHSSPTHTPGHGSAPLTPPSVVPTTPLSVKIGRVLCPGRGVQVSVTNRGHQTEDYAILTDGSISVADRIPAGATRRSTLNVKEDHTTTIAVTWNNIPVKSLDRHADCVNAHHSSNRTLPRTGPDRGMIIARVATGLAAVLTGAIIFWYGRLWPRRRDGMFD